MEGLTLVFVCNLILIAVSVPINLDCNPGNCQFNCSCFATSPPNAFSVDHVPQLVTLTFDDAVNEVNYPTYYDLLLTGRENKGNKCPIKATFYVSHDYTNYYYVNELFRFGSEMAVHSISHKSQIELWKNSNSTEWKHELDGMRTILSSLASMPKDAIRGVRAPFLQSGGDAMFGAMKDNGFTYDSSMPTRQYTDPPIWPYTLDYGFVQDCQIPPCPKERYPGLWILPMVDWQLESLPCAMVDACAPIPDSESDLLEFMKTNFLRHYQSNRAPFPVFLHESWLQNTKRRAAYLKFVDWMLEKDDVFLVTANEVIEYMKNPVSLGQYLKKECASLPLPENCPYVNTCYYEESSPGGSRYMVSCGECPETYPWVGNPEGL